MFHSRVIGTKSRNLDSFFAKEDTLRYLLEKNARDCEISVIEGVMGYYDGLAGISPKASAYDVARITKTPAVLIVNAKGMSLSAAAFVKGFVEYREDSQIRGVILNQISPMMYPRLKQIIEETLPVKVYGYVPVVKNCVLESRHLGLVMPEEIADLHDKLMKLAEIRCVFAGTIKNHTRQAPTRKPNPRFSSVAAMELSRKVGGWITTSFSVR